jgi:hypothetical protein
MPVTPAILKSHSVKARHEVEFGGPSVSVHHGKTLCSAVLANDYLGRGQNLSSGIVVLDY